MDEGGGAGNPAAEWKGKHAAFSSLGMGMALTPKPSMHLGPHASPAPGLASASKHLRSTRHPQNWSTEGLTEVVEAPECSRASRDAFGRAHLGQQIEENGSQVGDVRRDEHSARCPLCNGALQADAGTTGKMPHLWMRGLPRPVTAPEALVVGSSGVLVAIISRSLVRWVFRFARRVLSKAQALPQGHSTMAAPDEPRNSKDCDTADSSGVPAEAPPASGTLKSPPRARQADRMRIRDPLWQYAALAVYPERLKARTAPS